MKARSVSEIIADELRERIIRGDFSDGEALPPQAELLVSFGGSRTSVREALRILETEGLLTVRRGKTGGAIVHRPWVDNAAYALTLILSTNGVSLDDVVRAYRHLEPVCAALCARRTDREDAVLPALRDLHVRAQAVLADEEAFNKLSGAFHDQLVASCGNTTLGILIGALHEIWHSETANLKSESFAEELKASGDAGRRHQAFEDHDLFIKLIARGDADGVARAVRQHHGWAPADSRYRAARAAPLRVSGGLDNADVIERLQNLSDDETC